jgi:hypothetical protein
MMRVDCLYGHWFKCQSLLEIHSQTHTEIVFYQLPGYFLIQSSWYLKLTNTPPFPQTGEYLQSHLHSHYSIPMCQLSHTVTHHSSQSFAQNMLKTDWWTHNRWHSEI